MSDADLLALMTGKMNPQTVSFFPSQMMCFLLTPIIDNDIICLVTNSCVLCGFFVYLWHTLNGSHMAKKTPESDPSKPLHTLSAPKHRISWPEFRISCDLFAALTMFLCED